MAFNRVNPPKQLVLPRKIQEDIELKKAFDDRDYILFQLWKRLGGGDDFVNDNQNDLQDLSDQLNARIDSMIELLTEEFKELNILTDRNGLELLEQIKLLNNRFEEAFDTKLTEADND